MNSLDELIAHHESVLSVLKQAQADIAANAGAAASKEQLRNLLLKIDGMIPENEIQVYNRFSTGFHPA